ncbi:phage tail tape measure protein [Candidatus Saccharibacteria bacterium]|nr:phage tail tape measure protein [Candidatus Saccharibacteria bacterium]
MAGTIKGITIEFRGETTQLDSAMKQINNETRSLDRELRQVDNALKFNPTNIELWRQKQQLLTQKVSETRDKLDLLKRAQAQMDADGVDKSSEEYRKLQREIITTESKLHKFEGDLKQVGNIKMKALSNQIKSVGNKLDSAANSMRGLSTAGATVAGAIGGLAVKSGKWADDLNTMSKRYSLGTKELQKYSAAADLVDVSTEAIAKSHQKLARNMMSAKDGTGSAAEAFAALGINVTNADGSLRNGDDVWQEAIQALGSMKNETERDALAMQLMGKSASELNPLIEDGGETYKNVADTLKKYNLDFVDQETLDKANAFNDQLDTMKAVGLVALQSLGAELAGYLEPALRKVAGWMGKLAEWLGSLDPEVLTIIATIGGVVAAIAPLLMVFGKLAFAISSIINLVSVIGPAMTGLAGPIGIAIAIIAALIAVGVLLYKNWDKIKAAATKLKNGVVAVFTTMKERVKALFTAIKEVMVAPIEKAKELIKGIIEKIKGFFNFKFKMPHIKVPHFSIDPPGWRLSDLLEGIIPSLGIKWYAKGGIFNSPTVAGLGDVKGGEAAVPLEPFWKRMDRIVEAVESQDSGTTTINVYASEGMNVKQLALEVEKVLVRQQQQKKRVFA